ncbi:MAG: DUF3828 domain-containing protein [Nitrospirota bacterium]
MKYKIGFITICLLIFSVGASHAQDLKVSPENFIRSLYKDYLKEYLSDTLHNKYWFDDGKKMSQYFDRKLTSLLLRDPGCAKKTHEICNLDFDPIIDAQDFDEKLPVSVVVTKMDSKFPVCVKVVFSNISPRTIIFELKQTEQGWRISDIIYSDGSSLVKMLSQPIEDQ